MKALILTNEYPPHIYGGAGVHVDYLTRELARMMDVEVRFFGENGKETQGVQVQGGYLKRELPSDLPESLRGVLATLDRNTGFVCDFIDADVIHCHTWYTHLAGIIGKLTYGLPLVVTIHSLEPLRPWKREQLGGGYDYSCWVERTAIEMADAVIAVSEGTRQDVKQLFNVQDENLHVVYNGIESEDYFPGDSEDVLRKFGVNPDIPYVLFVGRITRQKGIVHLVRALEYLDEGVQVVLCAGAPDTPEIAEEMRQLVEQMQQKRKGIHWIPEMVSKEDVRAFYAGAQVFCCPSIYEPFGIINLEAMACETAVVASAVGGIREVVVPGETGILVELEQEEVSPFEPKNPDKFARDLADAINALMRDPERSQQFGEAGRKRALEKFSWRAIAKQTSGIYEKITRKKG